MSEALALEQLGSIARAVVLAVLPLTMLFMIIQVLFLQLPAREVARVLTGTLVASAGLFLFLVGVSVAFLPFGRVLGEAIGGLTHTWLAVGSGVLLGFATAWGEPAVRVLAEQVEEASAGSIRRSAVLVAVCIGVALSVGIGMLRIGYEIPLVLLLVPGYALVLALMWFGEKEFVAIAVDAGGVATGPLANSFLLAFAFGATSAMGGGDPLVHGLGLVSLIALAPVISVIALGLLVRWKERRKEP